MARRDTRLRTALWAREIRGAQEDRARHAASEQALERDARRDKLSAAQASCDEASEAWHRLHASSGPFFLGLAQAWAAALDARIKSRDGARAAFVEAERNAEQGLAAWRRALMRRDRSDDEVALAMRARRQWRDELRLAEQADRLTEESLA